ncbi:hypothetical protein BH753_gp079 [Bacillus phage Shbh1]|uniref:Uncharacterized protein n=1 Tax=Bacillus phage Shbh1 TaxID=1796992 RepID=A0A142F1A4_9CAUD|nr:hypothetical protein BH753_gp079 [Bacillus phage Shbh1]AMQ66561.1 hypothetical protein [Bacillus phage Shbh1]
MGTRVRVFKSKDDLHLIIKSRKSAVILEAVGVRGSDDHKIIFNFTSEDFKELFNYLMEISNKCWNNLTLKMADSIGSDYFEYYDRELDNNGYLYISSNTLKFDRPYKDSDKLYQFNKSKMQSFLYDLREVVEEGL